jgi:hypothetical protein
MNGQHPETAVVPAAASVDRPDPLEFILAATTRATQLAIEDVHTLVLREDVKTLPPRIRAEVVTMLRDIAAAAETLAGRLESSGE